MVTGNKVFLNNRLLSHSYTIRMTPGDDYFHYIFKNLYFEIKNVNKNK